MLANLLQTKLYIPSLRPSFVPRTHLIEKLNEGLYGKLTLISAPAGFGKTALVTEWIHDNQRPIAWLSLDQNDTDPLLFLKYVISAIHTLFPTIGEDILIQTQSLTQVKIESLLTSLLNEITTAPENFVLVLDDYHLIDSQDIHNCLNFLLEYQPPPLHLVIITREDPDLSLARLRAQGQLTELRATDLRFTANEVDEFLNQAMGLNLSPTEINAIETRTEGWIAGLQMAAIAMQSPRHTQKEIDITGFIEAFTGSHRFVLDYLVEEVLQRQSNEIRNFLLHTSILTQLNGSLCNAVTREESGRKMLEFLERANLFVIPLDDNRQWYRYHHLFADVLQVHLQHEQPGTVLALHQRASQWYAHNQMPDAAIHHALEAPDFEQAATLIEMSWPALVNGIRPTTWLGWVQSLPIPLVSTRPVLNLGAAYCLLNGGELELAERYLHNVEQLLEASSKTERVVINDKAFQTLPYFLTNARAYLAQAHGHPATTIEYAQQTLKLIPQEEHYHRGLAHFFIGLAQWSCGNLDIATQSFKDSIFSMQQTNNRYFQALGTTILANIKVAQGQLHEAKKIYKYALEFTLKQSQFALREAAEPHIGLSEIYLEKNQLTDARQQLQKGKQELTTSMVFLGVNTRWYLAMARIKMAEYDWNSAFELLQEAEKRYKRDPFPDLYPLGALKARLWLAQGELSKAFNWVQEQNLTVDDELTYQREFMHMTLAKILVAKYKQNNTQKHFHQANKLLERLLTASQIGGRLRTILEILIQKAILYQAYGDTTTALNALQQAIDLAEPQEYLRIFIDEGIPIKTLLGKISPQKRHQKNYVNRLLAIFNGTKIKSSILSTQPLIDPLSERELEVLELVAQGLSNREISERLYLALSTVKGHNRNIYSKLQVKRRTEAIARARELGLL
ncbi:MAG TPA: LuxR C-terminal-related transcriptional regulator [Anaerolineae bacterium]|nr:LuxR C-terminal-related transcriptional regulator [Anaerolineae bacterium]